VFSSVEEAMPYVSDLEPLYESLSPVGQELLDYLLPKKVEEWGNNGGES
jgi:hypothetical protein